MILPLYFCLFLCYNSPMKKIFAPLFIIHCSLLFVAPVHASDAPDFKIYEDVSVNHKPTSMPEVEKLLLNSNSQAKKSELFGKNSILEISYFGCPFYTMRECLIWKRKPTMMETIPLPARHIKKIDGYQNALVNRYESLMRAARSCCTTGMENKLKNAGASQGLIYKFMVDDANFYGFGDRCLMMSDQYFDDKYSGTATAKAVMGVRDTCLCQRLDYFDALLAPFDDFPDDEYNYTYQDGLNRRIQVSISDDVRTVKEILARCK